MHLASYYQTPVIPGRLVERFFAATARLSQHISHCVGVELLPLRMLFGLRSRGLPLRKIFLKSALIRASLFNAIELWGSKIPSEAVPSVKRPMDSRGEGPWRNHLTYGDHPGFKVGRSSPRSKMPSAFSNSLGEFCMIQ
jgi:hypothetical protein